MTAGGEHSGLHKRWLERKLEIEVGKVQAKLLSKGLTVPVPDPDALETEARLAQSHLPKLYIELYGRNPNGTLKLSPDANKRNGPLAPATVVQKLDRMLNPALLTPLPMELALAHGLPLSCCDTADAPVSGAVTARGGRASTSHIKQGAGGGGSSVYVGPTESGSPPRVCRSPPPLVQVQVRPDLQAADARIDDAVAEVHRVALQANEMSPRERVLYLARQANPNFHLLQPRSVQLAAMPSGPSRRELFRKSFSKRQMTSFLSDSISEAAAGGGSGGPRPRQQASASRRSLGGGGSESRRSREPSHTSVTSSGSPTGGAPTGDGTLPPLATRSQSISRASSSREPGAAAEHGAASAAAEGAEGLDALPRLSPSVSPVPPTPPLGAGEVEAVEVGLASGPPSPGTKLPPVHFGGEAAPAGILRGSGTGVKPDSLIGLWGAAAIVHAAEAEAERAKAEEAEAEAEAAAAAAEAEAEAADAAAEAALEAEVDAEARAAAGLLALTPMVSDGGRPRRSGEHKQRSSGPGGTAATSGHRGPSGDAGQGTTHGSVAPHGAEVHHGGMHGGSSWVP